MLRRASTGVPVAIDTLDEPYRLPLGARGPAREYTPRQLAAGFGQLAVTPDRGCPWTAAAVRAAVRNSAAVRSCPELSGAALWGLGR